MNVFPFLNYKKAWIDFREITNETAKTAQHLITYTSFTKKNRILDLGGGDGILLKAILEQSSGVVTHALLVELEQELITKAKKNLQSFGQVEFSNQDIANFNFNLFNYYEGVLASHVLYLLKDGYVNELLNNMKSYNTLYIVLDEPYSVFDSFWIHTAPLYHERLIRIHETLSNLSKKLFAVNKSIIRTQMKNPFLLADDKKNNVLSLLCYKDVHELLKKDPSFFGKIFKEVQSNNVVYYNSYCYEISKI